MRQTLPIENKFFKFAKILVHKTMKRHFIIAVLVLALTTLTTSCLKNNESAIFYASQEIPNINEFMPHRLLTLLGDERLHFGEEPPMIQGVIIADSTYIVEVNRFGDTTSIKTGKQLSKPKFTISGQVIGTAKMDFLSPQINNYGDPEHPIVIETSEYSNIDSTRFYLQSHQEIIAEGPDAPAYFKNHEFNLETTCKTYIMGSNDKFTIYYYETLMKKVPDNIPITWFLPIVANVISGEIVRTPDGHIASIKDFFWGKEVMGYVKYGPSLQQIISQGGQPGIGDTWYIDNHGYNALFAAE